MLTINQKFHMESIEDMVTFLRKLETEWRGYPFVTPSGHVFTHDMLMRCGGEEGLKRKAAHWRHWTEVMPYREILPTLDEIYEWVSNVVSKEEIPAALRQLDQLYAVFSAPFVTGEKCSRPAREKTDYYVRDGKLICCFKKITEQKYELPEYITAIGSQAFHNCDRLFHVVLHKDVKYVEEYAFDFTGDYALGAKLTLLEVLSGETEFMGNPTNLSDYYDYDEDEMLCIIAEPGSKAAELSIRENMFFGSTVAEGIVDFLSKAEEYEGTAADVGHYMETKMYFKKAELAAEYGLVLAGQEQKKEIITAFARAAFHVWDEIRGGCFKPDDAALYLLKYDLLYDFLKQEREKEEELLGVRIRILTECNRQYRYRIENVLSVIPAEDVAAFLEGLSEEKDFNKIHGYYTDDRYENREFLILAYQMAGFFVVNRLTGWEKVWEAATALSEAIWGEQDAFAADMTEELKEGWFRLEDMEKWLTGGYYEEKL